MDREDIPTPSKHIAARMIGGNALLLDPRSDVLRRLNPVGSFVWGLIEEGGHSLAALEEAVVDEFEIDSETAHADVSVFLEKLLAEDFVTLQK